MTHPPSLQSVVKRKAKHLLGKQINKAPNTRRIIFFPHKILQFSSLQEESSDSDQKYSSIWRTCTTVSGVQTDLIGCTTGLVVHVRQKITSTPLSIGCTTAFGVLAYYS